MSKSLRLFLFLLFLFAFLISAPIVVLYTAGYRFDILRGRIVHTAVLTISSEPHGASVTIDDISYSDRTPAVIETILPGEHLVRLEKADYLPWETTLSFQSREARVIGPVILFLQDEPTQQDSLAATLVSSHAQTNRFAYVTQGSSWLEVWLIDAANAQKKLLTRLPYVASSTYALSWSKNGEYLALTQHKGSQQDLSVTRVEDGMTVTLPDSLQEIQESWWDLDVETIFYVRSSTTLTRIDVANATTQTLPYTANLVSLHDGKEVSLSQTNNRAAVSFQEGGTASIITYLPLGTYAFVPAPQGLLALFDTHRQRLILLDPQSSEQPILFNEEATVWKWNPAGDALLYSSGYDLKRYDRWEHESQTITRLSTTIDQVDWFPKGSTALYRSGGEIVAINLYGATILSQTSLAQDLPGTFWISHDGTSLWALVLADGTWQWWERPLQK